MKKWSILAVFLAVGIAGGLVCLHTARAGTTQAVCGENSTGFLCLGTVALNAHVQIEHNPGVCHADVSQVGAGWVDLNIVENLGSCPWGIGITQRIDYTEVDPFTTGLCAAMTSSAVGPYYCTSALPANSDVLLSDRNGTFWCYGTVQTSSHGTATIRTTTNLTSCPLPVNSVQTLAYQIPEQDSPAVLTCSLAMSTARYICPRVLQSADHAALVIGINTCHGNVQSVNGGSAVVTDFENVSGDCPLAGTATIAYDVQATPPPVRFAVIGDYGQAGQAESDVANLIRGQNVDFVITTGDNNYDLGSAATIDANIGQYFHQYIAPYTGSYGAGASTNRFFPTLGNHEYYTAGAVPYFNYFTLPGNERYYDYVWGSVHFFAINSDTNEPDGITATSVQAQWLRDKLAASTAPFKIVYFHHAPYSSGTTHGSYLALQWPFRDWGADLVLVGHEHNYERVVRDGLTYVVIGNCGKSLYPFASTLIAGSQTHYNLDHGALFGEVDGGVMNFVALNRTGREFDRFSITSGGIFCPDIPKNLSDWFVNNVYELAQLGVAKACQPQDQRAFRPGDPISRAEFASMLLRVWYHDANHVAPAATSASVTCPDSILSNKANPPAGTEWFFNNVYELAQLGIAKACQTGTSVAFRPGDNITRAEAAGMLLRVWYHDANHVAPSPL
ncbi:MAG: metallophosphoesterase [Patescibacteria group bacterium]|nr:metallophosphoesterase [Patescibacteria group bacterium]